MDAERRVLVSGGTSGIGAAIARAFALNGARVSVTGASAGEAQAAAARPDMAGIECQALDVRDAEAVAAWVGMDDVASLGRGEFAARAALPIWIESPSSKSARMS